MNCQIDSYTNREIQVSYQHLVQHKESTIKKKVVLYITTKKALHFNQDTEDDFNS